MSLTLGTVITASLRGLAADGRTRVYCGLSQTRKALARYGRVLRCHLVSASLAVVGYAVGVFQSMRRRRGATARQAVPTAARVHVGVVRRERVAAAAGWAVAVRVSCSASLRHFACVFRVRSGVHVGRVYARRIVARMEQVLAFWYCSVREMVGEAVGLPPTPKYREGAVAASITRTVPQPARSRAAALIDFLPKQDGRLWPSRRSECALWDRHQCIVNVLQYNNLGWRMQCP